MSSSTDKDMETKQEIKQVLLAAAFLVLFFLLWNLAR